MRVALSLIEKAVVTIIGEMKQRGMDSVPLDTDFHWNVPSVFIYDSYNEPAQLDIGQLTGDYETLKLAQEANKLIMYNIKKCIRNIEILT